jgi:hypothetical protein
VQLKLADVPVMAEPEIVAVTLYGQLKELLGVSLAVTSSHASSPGD